MRRSLCCAFSCLLFCLPVWAADPRAEAPRSTTVIVSFVTGSSRFQPSAEDRETLAHAKEADLIVVRGRTSTQHGSKKDEALALARAKAARAYLLQQGVSPLKMTLNYVSGADYLADNSTAEGEEQNRRVEIELIYVSKE